MIVVPLLAAPTAADPVGWRPEEPIGPVAGPPYEDHATVVSTWATGAAVAVWVAGDRRAPGPVTVARRDRQGRWGVPVALSTAVRPGSTRVDAALGGHGVASVVWGRRTAAGGWEVSESHLRDGSWTAATLASLGSQAGLFHPPRVAVDGRGTTTVVWSKGGVHGARRFAGSDRWHPEDVAALGGARLQVASNNHGDVVVAWSRGAVVLSAALDPGAGWSRVHELTRDRRAPSVNDVQASVDGRGRGLVVWSVTGLWDEARADWVDYAAGSRSTRAGHWSPPATITDRIGEDGSTDSLTMPPSGAAVLVWYQIHRTDSPFQIWTARFRPDGRELDANGRGRHLTVVYARHRQLLATALTVTK